MKEFSGNKKYKTGSFAGFGISVAIGFIIYFLLKNITVSSQWLNYNVIVENAADNVFYKFIWLVMNFTEAEFFAGFFASLFIILGGFVAWRLDVKGSSKAGFPVAYGSNVWPWVFAAQIISVFIANFVMGYTRFFNEGYTWLPTFISVVGIAPAIMLLYGPSLSALLTSSILAGIVSFPVAFWISNNIIPVLEVPGVVANVFTMAITGIFVTAICKALPWVKKKEPKPIKRMEKSKEDTLKEMESPTWFVRRVLADFTEAQFYGNEIAGAFVIIGVILDWVLNMNHGAYGSGVIPAILLSQFIGSAVGVFLYFNKYVENGWYATFVPVVSVGPACVLMFGGTIKVAVVAGILGGIIGGPLAEFICKKLPDGYHPTIGNVTSMGLTTIIVSTIISVLPGF